MLSQALPNELVAPKSLMPPRVKSAYLKLVGSPTGLPDPNGISGVNFKPANSFDGSFGEDVVYRSTNLPAELKLERNPTVHEIVSARNANQRIKELEQTNLNLRRMLDLVVTDPTNGTERIKTSGPRLLLNRSAVQNPLGPPVLRQGRIGSSWRHIKQTNNYGNSNLLFIDGTVRINDSMRFPPRVYGYPPRVNDQNAELIGLSTQSLNDLNLPSQERVRSFEYWTKDKREPDNNRTKAKMYTTGAYKTFYGLSDSLLKL
ncbi:unnamed protein product [Brachionus calyciflorus]|uniref:Uncharacterized protein n=1 Tax=Brachionus calyciflorus TaxID=104777 RepID=A0A813MR32_9BILA|nr:unnamed protein product [Brachionus calyciflorus]